jgi:hypothetical protein
MLDQHAGPKSFQVQAPCAVVQIIMPQKKHIRFFLLEPNLIGPPQQQQKKSDFFLKNQDRI